MKNMHVIESHGDMRLHNLLNFHIELFFDTVNLSIFTENFARVAARWAEFAY